MANRFYKQRKWVRKLVRKWRGLLNLRQWEIILKFKEREKEDIDYQGSNYAISFQTEALYPYLQASIVCYLPTIQHISKKRLERDLVHELMHIMINEMRSFSEENGIKHEERVCSLLTRSFLYVYNHDK